MPKSSTSAMSVSKLLAGVSDDALLPLWALSDQPQRPQLSPLMTRICFEPNYHASPSSACSSLSTKENVLPSATSLSGSPLFESPSYDSFFSTFKKPLCSSPMTYEDLWSSSSFLSNQHPTISPATSSSTLMSFSSLGLSISPWSGGSSPHSSSLLSASAMPCLSLRELFADISMDSINQAPLSPSKRKMVL